MLLSFSFITFFLVRARTGEKTKNALDCNAHNTLLHELSPIRFVVLFALLTRSHFIYLSLTVSLLIIRSSSLLSRGFSCRVHFATTATAALKFHIFFGCASRRPIVVFPLQTRYSARSACCPTALDISTDCERTRYGSRADSHTAKSDQNCRRERTADSLCTMWSIHVAQISLINSSENFDTRLWCSLFATRTAIAVRACHQV